MLPSLNERFWAKVELAGPDECWLWAGLILNTGYGQIAVGSRTDGTFRQLATHRYAYELLVDKIPPGMTIDHLCLVRNCVNPIHMEVVTRAENTLRAGSLEKARAASLAKRRAQTHCKRGHPFDEANTYRPPNGNHRVCRICHTAFKHSQRP